MGAIEGGKPYSYMVEYLDAMEGAMYMAAGPEEDPPLVLAALGPKMLALAAERTAGAHPYFVPPEHTATAREIMGPDALLAPEQKVCLDAGADHVAVQVLTPRGELPLAQWRTLADALL